MFYDMKLLCTFTQKNKLDKTINDIESRYSVVFDKIYVLENRDNNQQLMCTYNINSEVAVEPLSNTISIHRKKQTNTLYSINALNALIIELNAGVKVPNFVIEWEKYRNALLTTDEYGLMQTNTKLYSIIDNFYLQAA